MQKAEAARAASAAMDTLTELERQVLRLRYGIGTAEHARVEIGTKLNIALRQVSRIQATALQKLHRLARMDVHLQSLLTRLLT